MSVVFMFPGQSSRYPGMLEKFAALHAPNRRLLERASELLDRNLFDHYRADNADAYATNRDVQIGVFLANHMALQLLTDQGITASASLGLSLGEWNHLVHIGLLRFEDALLAVERRGAAYDNGPRGMMASIFPLSYDDLREALLTCKSSAEIVNLNSPRQNVIAGEQAAVEKALAFIEDEFFVEGVVIERQVPMHASIFAPVGATFADCIAGLPFLRPKLPYLPNRLARWVHNPSTPQLVELLSSHIYSPVLWRQSIDLVIETFEQPTLVEVGPKAVLTNLLDRKWHKNVAKCSVDSLESTSAHIVQMLAKLGPLQPSLGAPEFGGVADTTEL